MTIPLRIDLNGDLGELEGAAGLEHDSAMLKCISSASVACGGHAGSSERLRQLAVLCRDAGVAFGAHPGYEDRVNFGRVDCQLSSSEVQQIVERQVRLALNAARGAGIRLAHVKPHGALYNRAAICRTCADAIVEGVRAVAPDALLFGLAGSRLIEAGKAAGMMTVPEAFADRGYSPDGTLVPRTEPGAVLENLSKVIARVQLLVRQETVIATDGTAIPVAARTVCLHGDHAHAVQMANALRAALEADGISICAPDRS